MEGRIWKIGYGRYDMEDVIWKGRYGKIGYGR
jgi:hypothetical protein